MAGAALSNSLTNLAFAAPPKSGKLKSLFSRRKREPCQSARECGIRQKNNEDAARWLERNFAAEDGAQLI